MPRQIRIAATQMDVSPASTEERLRRAELLVQQSAEGGAQLVVLPELFNVGYVYDDANYRKAEFPDGLTVPWLKRAAAQYGVHICGTLLLVDGDHVYNAAVMAAPDGRTWRYDKQYPWGWERAYYREGHNITIADTDLGKLGMMICWDYAHPELWQRYAGKVDAMVVMSCPPRATAMRLRLPDGRLEPFSDERDYFTGSDSPFGADMNEQSAWLGVPLVNSTGAGTLVTAVPSPYLSMLGGLARNPELLSYLPQAPDVRLETDFYPQAKVVDANGNLVSRAMGEGDAFVLGDVLLPDQTPQPVGAQPRSRMKPLAYLYSDVLLPAFTIPNYRAGYRRRFGDQFAPHDPSTLRWAAIVLAALLIGFIFGRSGTRGGARS
jgi:hypothetical protein